MEPRQDCRALIVPLLLIEQCFFLSNVFKIPQGGWFPVLMAGLIAIAM